MENKYYILIAGTIVITILFSIVLRKLLNIFINKYAEKLATDPTNFSFLKNSIGFIVYTAGLIFIFYKIPYLKSIGTGLFAGAGVIALVVGFASQKAFSNIIGGVFILIFKPFKIGDIIEVSGGKKGIVEEITLKHTIIKDYENRRIIIPNSIISEETIINSSIQDEKIRKHIYFSIAYHSNIDTAIRIIQEEACNHPMVLDNRNPEELKDNEHQVLVRVVSLGEYSVDLKAYIWSTGNDQAFVVECDLLKSVKERFDAEGIEIPYPYKNLIHHNKNEG